MTFKFSDLHKKIIVQHFDGQTGEYIEEETVEVPPHTGLPADCTEVKPPAAVAGKARVWNGKQWDFVTDMRGQTVYLKRDGSSAVMTDLGDLLDAWTTEPPPAEYVKWLNDGWVLDDEKELSALIRDAEQHKESLLNYSESQLKPLLYAEKLDMLTETETVNMQELMRHIVLVSRVDTKDPKNISWPELSLTS